MTCLHPARFVALVSVVLAIPGSVAATSCSEPVTLRIGFLGSELHGEGSSEFVDDDILWVPRNVAIYANRAVGTPTDFGFPFPLVELSVQGLWAPETPLPAGTEISFREQTAITTTEIDTEPPTGVGLVEVNNAGCGLFLSIEGSPTDDRTLTDQLTYVVYAGTTAEEATTTPIPRALVPKPNVWQIDDSDALYVYGDRNTRWYVVSVLDLAGNESLRSEAVPLAPPGCRSSVVERSGSSSLILFGLVALFMGSVRSCRRRKRPETGRK